MEKLYSLLRHARQRVFSGSRKTFCLLMVSMFVSGTALAQLEAGNYHFTAASGTFTQLDTTTATRVPAIEADAAISGVLPLGFTFTFEGVNYTDVKASSDGFLTFNTAATNTGSDDLPATLASRRPLVAPLWDDLDGKAIGGSVASYITTGTAGSRVFTFEWRNWEWRWSSNDPVMSFQVKLYEGTNQIEFIYRQESGATTATPTLGASIGIAGAATGAGNYLSLNNATANPTASSTVNSNNIHTKPATGQIYRFTPPVQAPIDAGVSALVDPVNSTGCFGSLATVTVRLRNFGTSALTSVPVTVNMTGAATASVSGTFSGSLAPGATTDFTLPGTVDMSAAGNYNFTSFTTLAGDTVNYNDTLRVSRTVTAPLVPSLPMVTFTGFTGANLSTVFPGWTEATGFVNPTGTTSLWASNNVTGQTTAAVNLYTTSRNEWIVGPKFVNGNNTHLLFKAAVTAWSPAGAASSMGSDDSVRVMISADCGASFKMFTAITVADTLSTNLRQFDLDLSVIPAGTELIVAFFATDGPNDDPEDYYFHLDDIHIKEVAPIDATPVSLDSPLESGCYGAAEQIMVSIGNTGTTALSSVPVTVTVTGPGAPQTFTATHTSSLAPGTTASLSLPNIDMSAAGTYTFTIYTSATGDGDAGNDTLRVTRTVIAPLVPSLPMVTFTGFTGANLNSVFPGWTEATGFVNPTGTTSLWANNNVTGQTTAAVNLYTTSRNEWIVGPKFVNGNNTHLLFKAAVTAWSPSGAPSAMGSDDSVRVMISADCGASYKMFTAITAADTLSTTLRQYDLDLSAIPAGTELIVAFFATDGPNDDLEDYYFHLDDIHIKEVGNDDVGVIAVRSNDGCGLTDTEQICVTVQNFGAVAQSNIPVSFRINSGTIMTDTIAGPLAPGDTIQHCFTNTADLSVPGNYTIRAFTALAADGITSNDSTIIDIESILSPGTPTVSNVTRCGPGTVTLSATPQAGADINWYSSQTGLVADSTGNTFSPYVTSTTTFYVAAASGTTETVGKPSTLGSDGTNTGGGLIFNAQQPFTLQSVVVYYNGGGTNLTVQLQDASSNMLQTATIALPNTSGSIQAITVPLNFNVPAGTGLRLVQGTPSVSLYRDFTASAINFPYTSQSGNVTITDGTLAGYYYFFYNWVITSGCESARVPVTVTVTPADAISATASVSSICAGASTTLSVTSTNTSYTYSWTGGSLNNAAGASQTVSPATTTSYIVTATDGSCQNVDTVTVTVSPVSVAGTASVASDTVCTGNSATLRLTGATGSIQWQRLSGGNWVNETGSGATTNAFSVSPTQNTSYRAMVTSGACSAVNSNVLNLVVSNPQVTTTSGDTICGSGQATLTAAGTTGSQLRWYAAATGGTSLHNGGTYSPNVTATDTFYVAAVTGGGSATVGPALPVSTTGYSFTGEGLAFNVTTPITIQTVDMYAVAATNVTVELRDAANTVLATSPSISLVGGSVKNTVNLNFAVPAGTGFKLVLSQNTASTNIIRDNPFSGFPVASSNGSVTITGGAAINAYYYFYNWVISSGCESPRTAVVATVTSAPTPAITATGTSGSRSFSTAATGVSSYSWDFGDGSAVNTTANPTHTYANDGTYTVTLTVTYANGCTATATTQVTIVRTGLKENLAANVNLYPNPTNGVVYLELEKAEEVNIAVHNMQGQVVRRAQSNGTTKVMLDLEGLATGSYLIKVDNGKEMFTKKVLFQNLK